MKQAAKRRTPEQGGNQTEAIPGLGAPDAPVVHNVVLGGGGAGQPVNLLELLMEESGGGDRTAVMEAPARMQSPANPPAQYSGQFSGGRSADLTMPMAAVGAETAPKPSDFTAVLQAFQPSSPAAARVPTETDRPRFDGGERGPSAGFTSLVEGLLDAPESRAGTGGVGHTQMMNLGELANSGNPSPAMGTQVLGSGEKPARADRSPELPAAEPTLAGALRSNTPVAESSSTKEKMAGLVPWLLVAIAIELLAILVVLLIGGKH
jgi:hypothetical protein